MIYYKTMDYFIDQRIPGQEFVIYRAPTPSKKRKNLRLLGLALLGLSFVGFISVLGPLLSKELGFRLQKFPAAEIQKNEQKISVFGYLLWLDQNNLSSPVDWNFDLIIPKIGVNSRVVPNVDPNNKEEYDQVLKTAVAHAKGTSFPDSYGSTYIFGHSSTLLWDPNHTNAVFYLLKNLEKGDEIIVFYSTRRYLYQVVEKVIKGEKEIPEFVSQKDKKYLVLQTCWPPGTAWKRLFVLAEPVTENLSMR